MTFFNPSFPPAWLRKINSALLWGYEKFQKSKISYSLRSTLIANGAQGNSKSPGLWLTISVLLWPKDILMLEKNSCHNFQISPCKTLTYVLGSLPMRPELLEKWNQKDSHLFFLLPTCNSKLIFKVKNSGRKYFQLIPELFRIAHFIANKQSYVTIQFKPLVCRVGFFSVLAL